MKNYLKKHKILMIGFILLELYNAIILQGALYNKGVVLGNRGIFFELKESNNGFCYRTGKEEVQILPKKDDYSTITFKHNENKVTLLYKKVDKVEQSTIAFYTKEQKVIWSAVYYGDEYTQDTWLQTGEKENQFIVNVENKKIFLGEKYFNIVFQQGEASSYLYRDISKMIVKDTSYQLDGKMQGLFVGLTIQLLGVALLVAHSHKGEKSAWKENYLYTSKKQVEYEKLLKYVIFCTGSIIILLGLILTTVICVG